MINLNEPVQEFVSQNWLAVLMFLAFLKGLSRQFGVKALHKFYLVLQNVWSIVRPGTEADSLAKVNEKKKEK